MPEPWKALRSVTEADPVTIDRVARRVAAPHRRPIAGKLLVAAAVVVAAVRLGRPAPLDLDLTGKDLEIQPTDAVRLNTSGTGHLAGTARQIHIAWESGHLDVEVEPDRGITLEVVSPDGRVEVVGTGFSVDRGALGTEVQVRHGKVRVTCGAEAPILLDAGGARTCLPLTAAGLLGRARAQQAGGASPPVVIDTVNRGLALAPAGTIRDELEVVRIDAELAAQDFAAARAEADHYLTRGASHRRTDVLGVAATLAWTAEGCDAARPWLVELGDSPLPVVAACR